MSRDLMAKKEWARIWEAKNMGQDNENCIRIYMTQSPDVFAFQIRTFKPITERFGRAGKPRNMIAHVDLTLTEMEQILDYMKKKTGNSPRLNIKPLELIEEAK